MTKKTEPKLIIISLGQLDVTTGDGVITFARAFTKMWAGRCRPFRAA